MAEDTTTVVRETLYPDESFREMVEAGVFYGRKQTKTHPKMRPYILTNRNGMEIINLGKTTEMLDAAVVKVEEVVRNGGMILFVATQPAAGRAEEMAKEFGYPIVTGRWIGGTLTNFKMISTRIEHHKKLKEDWAMKRFEQYTKKERVGIEREIGRMTELLGGLEPLVALPALALIVDPALHMTALREARQLAIPIVALADTDSDPTLVDHPVVGNAKSRTSINWFLAHVRSAIERGKAGALELQKSAEEKDASSASARAGEQANVAASSSTAA